MKENAELREANNILKDAFRFFRKQPEAVTIRSIHRFIFDNRKKYHVNRMYKAFSINPTTTMP